MNLDRESQFLSVLVATLLLANPAPSTRVARAAGSTGSSQESGEADSGRRQNSLSAFQSVFQQLFGPPGKFEPIDVASFLPAARMSAREVPSLFLSEQQRVAAVEGFVKIVGIKSPSKEEAAVREELKHRLDALGFVEIPCGAITDPNAPLNLVMELPASPDMKERPAILLDAHMDTIGGRQCTPEEMTFDAGRREFHHNRGGAFGADDKTGIVTILSALEAAKTFFWDKGVSHRRIVVIFSAEEERDHAYGPRYLVEHYPEIFKDIEITLMNSGPLDYMNEEYPGNVFVLVVDEETSRTPPFSRVVALVEDMCRFKGISYLKSRNGLGHADLRWFPEHANTDLHIRAAHTGDHSRERVKLRDLFNHIDLLTYILLRWDGVVLELDEKAGHFVPVREQDGPSRADHETGAVSTLR